MWRVVYTVLTIIFQMTPFLNETSERRQARSWTNHNYGSLCPCW